MTENNATIHSRITSIEERLVVLEITVAVESERYMSILKRLEKIDSHVGRLVWLILGGIIAAFITFVVGGGLTLQ